MPDQSAELDPKRWIDETTPFLTPYAAGVPSVRLEIIKQHSGRARLGEIGLIVYSKIVTDKTNDPEEAQMGRMRAAVATKPWNSSNATKSTHRKFEHIRIQTILISHNGYDNTIPHTNGKIRTRIPRIYRTIQYS